MMSLSIAAGARSAPFPAVSTGRSLPPSATLVGQGKQSEGRPGQTIAWVGNPQRPACQARSGRQKAKPSSNQGPSQVVFLVPSIWVVRRRDAVWADGQRTDTSPRLAKRNGNLPMYLLSAGGGGALLSPTPCEEV